MQTFRELSANVEISRKGSRAPPSNAQSSYDLLQRCEDPAGYSLLFRLPPQILQICLWELQEELEGLLNPSPNALNKMMLNKTSPSSDPFASTAHPPPLEVPIIPECSFYTIAIKFFL